MNKVHGIGATDQGQTFLHIVSANDIVLTHDVHRQTHARMDSGIMKRPARRVCSSVTSRRRLSSQNCALVHISRASASSAAPRSAACAPSSALQVLVIYINLTVGYGPVNPPKGCSVHVRAEGSCVQLRLHGVAGRMPFMRDSSSIRDD